MIDANNAKSASGRQVAKELAFDARHAPYIDWQKIGDQAAELGADIETHRATDGAIRVTVFWRESAAPASDGGAEVAAALESLRSNWSASLSEAEYEALKQAEKILRLKDSTATVVTDTLRTMMGATAADPYVRAIARALGIG